MKELRIRILAGLFVVVGVLAWAGARLWNTYGTLPNVPEAAPFVLALLAAVLLATALSLRSRLKAQRERQAGAKGVEPMTAARAVLFGQACALVAAPVSGLYAGTAVFLLLQNIGGSYRPDQLLHSGLAALAGVAAVAAAVYLQRVCRLPEDDGDRPPRAGTSA